MNEVTEEKKELARQDGWTLKEIEKGYGIFCSHDVGNGAAHIERIDCLMKFDSDDEAAEYAERVDGIKLIHDIAFPVGDSHYANYLDTPENREVLYALAGK